MVWKRPYRIREFVEKCAELQYLEPRWENYGPATLMEMAANSGDLDDEEAAIVYCRLLFRGPFGEPLRAPMRGAPGLLGGTSCADWPHLPIHIFRGVPFNIVLGWTVGGHPEPPTWYLTHCLRYGVWNSEPYPQLSDDELRAVAVDFVENGPWVTPLDEYERKFILDQVE